MDTASGIDDRSMIPIVVKAIQQLAASIRDFAESFTSKEIHAMNLLCMGETCINEDQLKAMLAASAAAAKDAGAPASGAPASTPAPGASMDTGAATTSAAPVEEASEPDPEPDPSSASETDQPPAAQPVAANDNESAEDLPAALGAPATGTE